MFFSVTGGEFRVHETEPEALKSGGAILSSLELSTVRRNLLTWRDYTQFCGKGVFCLKGMPRTKFNGQQFVCECDWVSEHPMEFMLFYRAFRRTWIRSCIPAPPDFPEKVLQDNIPETIPETMPETMPETTPETTPFQRRYCGITSRIQHLFRCCFIKVLGRVHGL